MLGEGFDHPPLSVAAVFRPYRSLAPYIQFIGRVMRVIHQNAADHPDNQGVIVSHVRLNNEQYWDDFRELDLDEQEMVRLWLETDDPAATLDTTCVTGQPRRFDQAQLVNNEIISHFLEQRFLDPEDDRVLDEILNREIAPGLTLGSVVDRETLRERIRQQHSTGVVEYQEIPVSPQRRRQQARQRLAERSKSVAARILKDLKIAPTGRDLARAAGRSAKPNLQVAIALTHERVNDYLGIEPGMRDEISADQAAAALDHLDHIADELVHEYRNLTKTR